MNYKTAKELLFSKEALTEKQATGILDMWGKNSRTYYDLLKNEQASQALRGYVGVSQTADTHEFIELKAKVPSIVIANKFFELKIPAVTKYYIAVIENLSANPLNGEVCAWPYLTPEGMQHFDEQAIMDVVTSVWFVFDFKEDKQGNLFSRLLSRLNTETDKELFAANSFNILGWMKKIQNYPRREFFKYLVMSHHFVNIGVGPEAWFRKFYIRYKNDVENLLNQLDAAVDDIVDSPTGTPFGFPGTMFN